MRRTLFFSVIALSTFICGHVFAQAASSPPDACSVSGSNALDMTFEDFDSGEIGWRRWGDNGCEREAAALIIEFRNRHAEKLDPSQVKLLDWHAGQLYAGAGDYGFAIERMLLVQEQEAEPVELEYTKATIAFLRSDREALLAARERMVAIQEPANFSKAADLFVATYNLPRPRWPMNIDVVDRLITCFGWSYQTAYACPPMPGNISAQ